MWTNPTSRNAPVGALPLGNKILTFLPAPALPAAGSFCEVGMLTVKLGSVVAIGILWLHSYRKWYQRYIISGHQSAISMKQDVFL